MEEVLRKLYQEHHSTLQRKRIEKVIDGEQKTLMSRKKYDFREEMSLKTPQTNFSLDEDIRFQKEFYQTKKIFNAALLESRCQKIKLPFVTNKERRNKLKRKLKAIFLAVLFTQRLKGNLRVSLLKRKQKAEKYSKNFVAITQKVIKTYYQNLLKQELVDYVTILQKSITDPSVDQQKESLQMLYYMSSKLSSSTLTKELMEFFVYTATERGFPPSDFLSSAEINRLDFSPFYGCIVNVTQEQTRMIIALGLGIKIFCFYLLYQPWKLQCAGSLLIENYKSIKQTIMDIGSVFYCLIFQDFCLNIKEVRSVSKQLISNFGVKPIKTLNPFSEGEQHSTSKVIIQGQTRQFLNKVTFKYPNLVKSIKDNLFVWISRISYACLKESEKKVRVRDGGSTFFRTIERGRDEGAVSPESRRRFRSIELTRKKDELEKAKSRQRYYELPELKHSID